MEESWLIPGSWLGGWEFLLEMGTLVEGAGVGLRLGGGSCSASGHTWSEILPSLRKAIPCTVELGLPGHLSVAPDLLLKEKIQKFRHWEKQRSQS